MYTWYELNRHVNVGGGVGRLNGGPFIRHLTSGPAYTYPYVAINFKDNGKTRGPQTSSAEVEDNSRMPGHR